MVFLLFDDSKISILDIDSSMKEQKIETPMFGLVVGQFYLYVRALVHICDSLSMVQKQMYLENGIKITGWFAFF